MKFHPITSLVRSRIALIAAAGLLLTVLQAPLHAGDRPSDSNPTPTPAGTGGACPLTQGFWKNHTAAWPVSSLTLGGRTYTETELVNLLNTPVRGDASLDLAHQLIATLLDIANGSNSAPISPV